MKKGFLILTSLVLFLWPALALAYDADLALTPENVSFSSDLFVEKSPLRIYATVSNLTNQDLLGSVRFFNETKGVQISTDQPISVLSQNTDSVFVDWMPEAGNQTISVIIYPWNSAADDPANNTVRKTIYVDSDSDGDGWGNQLDEDDDNDGHWDYQDAFPRNPAEWEDTDRDGSGNNQDQDDDNDGIPDLEDDLPFDPAENVDSDGDGIGNNQDLDDDNDGLEDTKETELGTNLLNPDSDGDEKNDQEDAFPLDTSEWEDFDQDGTGDNADLDDDNDGLDDESDPNDHNQGPVIEVSNLDQLVDLKEEIVLDATPSHDPDGEIKEIKWGIDGKKISEEPTLEYAFETPGVYLVSLTLTDNQGETRTSQFKIRVIDYDFYRKIGIFILLLIPLAFLFLFKYIYRSKEEIEEKNKLEIRKIRKEMEKKKKKEKI